MRADEDVKLNYPQEDIKTFKYSSHAREALRIIFEHFHIDSYDPNPTIMLAVME